MSTKFRISEQILRLMKGNPTVESRFHRKEVELLVQQVSNQLLKAEHFNVNMAGGDTVPPNCMIYTYESVPVTTYKTTKSKAELPAIPINLPKGMGVFHVSKTDDIDNPFVPIPPGLWGIVKPQDLLGDLSGLIGYEVVGGSVVFTKNLPGLGIDNVFMRLVGVDISTVGDYDILPISADMEAQIVQAVYSLIVQAPPADKQVND
jgi:hypothetical protein